MNWCRGSALVCMVAALYFALWAASEDAKLKVTVEGGRIQFEPATVRLRVRVEPDPQNRALTVGIDSADFSTSSLEQLEGDRAPITRWRTFTGIPAGEYEAIAELYRAPNESVLARDRLTVLGRGF